VDRYPDQPRAPSQLSPADARTADVLFRSFGGRLFGYFRFMLGSDSGARRALGNTLAAAAPEAGRARDLDQYAPRLFMLAHAECHEHQSAEAVGAGQHWTVVTGSGNPVLPEIARRAVARLAPDVREAYILSAPHNNLTLPQMAEILQLGLDAAADLRAQAGLDFVRAVAVCATEAGFIQFGGAELRIRAEESLERDASEPAPSLPMLSGPVSAAFADAAQPPLPGQAPAPPHTQQPPRTPLPPPSSLPSALPSSVALPPPSALPPPQRQTLPPPPDATIVEPVFPEPGNPARFDQAVPGAFHGGPGYGDALDYDAPEYDGPAGYATATEGYGDAQGYDGEPEYYDDRPYGGDRGLNEHYRAALLRTGPLRAITGPMMLGDYTPRGRRRRKVLAWTGGGIAVAAAAVIGWQALASSPDSTMTLTHGGMPGTSVPVAPGTGGPTRSAPATPSQSPAASQSPMAAPTGAVTSGTGPESGAGISTGAASAAAAPRPTAASRPASVPATHAPSPAPAQTSAKPTTPAPPSSSPPATATRSPSAPASP